MNTANKTHRRRIFPALAFLLLCSFNASAQYVEPERDDTIRLMPKTPFDTISAKQALMKGKATIKGVAFTKPKTAFGYKAPLEKRIYANKIKVILFPYSPYWEEYLGLKKKVNPKKLKFAFIHPDAWKYRLEAITNSDGEFTFPNMKPGKYYIEGVLNWSSGAYYDQYTGSGYGSYGNTTNYYERKYYNVGHADLLQKIVEVTAEDEVVKIKLK
ncbi:carboxypeptidase-like regulatory domain-containing protein [Chitinophaga japonensis]|uniref:Carboxypeptidase family protein n=1 Tax=Chitinophaga japonensis TaxID=104662 RepID=A0A562TC96_CHIJA|nr:carboxypeptidase-like regulatory domain-containing protein [Chitinophaga japonensis]TWI91139.1 hypothetical protein LX66_0501 [Chitinophaga japonensis]